MLSLSRNTKQRNPSHFGSYCHSLPFGISSTERASIGGMGGFNDICYLLTGNASLLDGVTELKLSSEPCYVSSGCAALVYLLNRGTRFWKTSACRLSGISSLT